MNNEYKEICVDNLSNSLSKNNIAFLCGNGFSINFDDYFKDIFNLNKLYKAHNYIKLNSEYRLKANKIFSSKFNENFSSIMEYTSNFKKADLDKVFNDGLKLAKYIYNNESIKRNLKKNGYIDSNKFINQLEILRLISNENKIEYINLEYWTVLMYIVLCIDDMNIDINLSENLFIKLVRVGNKKKYSFINNKGNNSFRIFESYIGNGFNIYYRFLICTVIFNYGKFLDIEQLSNIKNGSKDLEKIKCFLGSFKLLITTNYDNIIDLVTKDIDIDKKHIHGEFIINKGNEYVYNQSLGIYFNENNDYVSISDILLGDYLVKNMSHVLYTLSYMQDNDKINKEMTFINNIISNQINKNNIDTFLIFGLNIENDQHLLTSIISGFEQNSVKNPKIIFSYFRKEEKDIFLRELSKIESIPQISNEYLKKLSIEFIQTNEILEMYFNK